VRTTPHPIRPKASRITTSKSWIWSISQNQTLNGERRKYQLGTSSFLNVVIVQRDNVTRQSAEVSALSAYARARNTLDGITGRILQKYNVSIEEAYSGKVKRPAGPIPILDQR